MTVTTKEYQDAFKIVIERLCKKKEFSCIKCKKWIASVGDGLHDTCEVEWKSFEEYGLCYECSTKEKDLDVARKKFQSSIDELYEAVYGPHAKFH